MKQFHRSDSSHSVSSGIARSLGTTVNAFIHEQVCGDETAARNSLGCAGSEYTAEMTFSGVLAWTALSLAALSPAALAQSRDRLAVGLEDITAAKLRAHLFFLSSDAMEGRMSLE